MTESNDKRSVGRPKDSGTRGQRAYSGKVDVRLDSNRDSRLNELAERYGVSRSDIMRKSFDDFYRWNSGEDE